MDDLLSEFLTETSESIALLDVELVKLEQEPNNPQLLSSIFRLVHTIKGTCGFLGLPRLEAIAHAAENVLGKVRDHQIEVSSSNITLILQSIDKIKDLLSALEQTGQEAEGSDQDLISKLNAVAEGKTMEQNPSSTPPVEASKDKPVEASKDKPVAPKQAAAPEQKPANSEEAAAPEEAPEGQKASAEGNKEEAPNKEEGHRDTAASSQSIRVNVALLENLMNMVSELVLTRNQLLQILREQKESEFSGPLQRLSHVTSELQEGVMKTRMQPIGNAWGKLPRLIRDLTTELNKKIELKMIGAETELDRQVLELIKDPLTHMVRNSADHGIEDPNDRQAVGKPATGNIVLNAHHEGGHIIIQITDDGRGLPMSAIRRKIVENGLATESELALMTESQIQQYIFLPGFSTAKKVTNVSGRGVGMDVVKTNLDKIGGSIEMKSIEGRGTRFTIKIPLTLAIVSALIVEACGERFAIPQISVIELVRISANSEHTIENLNNTPILRLRNRLLPLISLADLLKLDKSKSSKGRMMRMRSLENLASQNNSDEAPEKNIKEKNIKEQSKKEQNNNISANISPVPPEPNSNSNTNVAQPPTREEMYIVITQVGAYAFGIIVDSIFDTQEIVVKPVSPLLRNLSLFSGNTILGDGSVVMILDPNGIAVASGEKTGMDSGAEEKPKSNEVDQNEHMALLLFKAGKDKTPKTVPLALVARLEEFETNKIEYSDGKPVVQYREGLMPLISIDDDYEIPPNSRQPVLVFIDRGYTVGLMVHEIIDIIDQKLAIKLKGHEIGCIGSAVISGKTTEIIDTAYYLKKVYPDWFIDHDSQLKKAGKNRNKHILLIDDSVFFRNLLVPSLRAAGYDVTSVDSADRAMMLHEKRYDFDVIVSEVNLEGTNGFEFAKNIRSNSRWQGLPLIALSSQISPEYIEMGRKVGFDDYIAKTDTQELIDTLIETITLRKDSHHEEYRA